MAVKISHLNRVNIRSEETTKEMEHVRDLRPSYKGFRKLNTSLVDIAGLDIREAQ